MQVTTHKANKKYDIRKIAHFRHEIRHTNLKKKGLETFSDCLIGYELQDTYNDSINLLNDTYQPMSFKFNESIENIACNNISHAIIDCQNKLFMHCLYIFINIETNETTPNYIIITQII